MTSIPFWRRHVSVEVAGLTITEPKIEGNVRRKVGGEPPAGSLLVYNLAPNTQQRIKERNQAINVVAGYSDFQASIFSGLTQKVERDRDDLAGLTRITLTGVAQQEAKPTAAISYENESLHLIIADYVDKIGLRLASLNAIPNPIIENWYSVESAEAGLTRLLRSQGLSWYEENGVARVNRPSQLQTGAGTIMLSPQTGLVERPSETDAGARARSLLLPQVQLGTQIQLQSSTLSGNWKVVTLEHRFANWLPGDFFTDMELRPL